MVLQMHFLWVHRCNKPTGDVERTGARPVNHDPEANDLQAFLLLFQHSKKGYYAG